MTAAADGKTPDEKKEPESEEGRINCEKMNDMDFCKKEKISRGKRKSYIRNFNLWKK